MLITSGILDRMREERAQYQDFAVLYRTNSQSRAIEEALRRRNVPYMIYSGNSFFDRAEIRDMMAYFNPGSVSLILSDGATDEVLLTRMVESQEILVLNVSAPPPGTSKQGVSVSVDTTRNWTVEDFVIGKGGDKGEPHSEGVLCRRRGRGEDTAHPLLY